MKRKNTTRNALVTSIISLLLCVTMLVGTTFAWFTDSVESGRNVIAAGNLDVELLANGKEVDAETMLFDDVDPDLWEPGAVAYENLQVANVGSLALKYNLNLTVLKETVINGKKLSDVIMVGVIEGGVTSTDRKEVVSKVGTWTKLSEFNLNMSGIALEAGEKSAVSGVVLYWQPTENDNDYNMNNDNRLAGNVLSLEIGVKLMATQLEFEDDSFGPDYDKEALLPVTNVEELAGALTNGESVKLDSDVELNQQVKIPEGANVVIDLNDKELAGSVEIPGGSTLTVDNGAIVNTNSDMSGIQNNGGELVLNDVDITSARHGVRVEGGTAIINGGKYSVDPTSGMTVHALNVSDGAHVTINDGTFVGPRGTLADSGSAVCVQAGSTVIINGGNFSGGKNSTLATKEGANLTIYGGTFDQDPFAYVAIGYDVIENDDGTYTVAMTSNSLGKLLEHAQPGETVNVPAGTYSFPASKLQDGDTLICAEGTVFNGVSSMSISGATVIGATFDADGNTNDGTGAGTGTINGTFKNCTFTGNHALRYCYAGETVVFEDCIFDADYRGIHFDELNGDVYFKNCVINGFQAIGGGEGIATFENCTFGASKHSYNGLNLYCNTVLKDCEFEFVSGKTNFVDLEGTGKTLTITNCTATMDGEPAELISYIGGSKLAQNTVVYNGATYVTNQEGLTAAIDGGVKEILLAAGEYELTKARVGVTIKGVDEETVLVNASVPIYGKTGAIYQRMHFENLTLTNTISTFQDTATEETGGTSSTFTNVTFAAGFRHGYGSKVVFTDCTFGSNSEGYALHFETDPAGTAGEIKLTGCVFKGGKVHLGGPRTYGFTNCDFAAGTDFQVWSGITLDDCTVAGVEITADNIVTAFPALDMKYVTIK